MARVAVMTLALLLLAGPALAQSRLVITEFAQDDTRQFEDTIADELLFRSEYDLVPYERFLDEVHDYGQDLESFLRDPGRIVDLARFFEYDAIVFGQLDRRRRPRQLTITVYDGGTGSVQGEATFPISSDQLEDAGFDRAMIDVEDWIARSERPGGRGGQASAEASNTGAGEAVGLSFIEGDDDSAPSSAGWLQVFFGLDMMSRDFTIKSSDEGAQYDSGFYAGVEGWIDVYPIRAFSPGTLDGLGLRFRLARYFVSTTLILDEQSLDIPTRQKEWGLTLLYRHFFGDFELVTGLGYESLAFTLGDNPIYPSSEYRSLAIDLGGWYGVVANLLRLGINVEIRPAPSLGDAETEAFGAGSSFGFALGAAVELTPLPHVSVQGFYRFRQFSTSYDGNGTSDLQGALDGTDRYHTLGLRIGYVY